MRYVDQTTGQITGVGSLHSGICQTLTGTVGRDEVFQHRHTLLEVRQDGVLNNLGTLGTGFLGLGHQTTHTGELANLVLRTTGTGVEHHEYGVEALVGLGHLLHQHIAQVVIDVCPRINNLVVTLVVGDETHIVVFSNLAYFLVTLLHQVFLGLRDNDVVEVERQTCLISHAITEVLDSVKELAGLGKAYVLDYIGNDVTQRLLGDNLVDVANLLRNDAIHDDTTDRGLYHVLAGLAVDDVVNQHLDLCMQVALAFVVGDDSFLRTIEGKALTLGTRTYLRDIVQSQHHILRRNGDRGTIGRVQDVVALKHQNLCLQNGLVGQGKVDSHLVTVEVGIERGTSQRVQLDSLTLDELGLEGLNTQTVQRRCTVEQNRMALHDVLQNIPDNRLTAVYNLLGRLDGLDNTALDKLADDKRLVELGGHQLRQTALTHLQLRTYDDNRTGRVVDTLTEQVLTEAALLTLQRVGERLQRTVAVALYGTALATVVKQGVDSFLQHAFLIAQDNLRSLDLHQTLQTVVTNDDATIEVVQV